jgi:hypothetical protein
MEIKEAKSEIMRNMVNIPKWIDTTSSLHHLVWHQGILVVNDEVLKLVTRSILTEKIVFKIYTNITALLDNLYEITSTELQMKILVYFSKLFIYLEDFTLENELFEITANLQRFTDLYYQIKIIK